MYKMTFVEGKDMKHSTARQRGHVTSLRGFDHIKYRSVHLRCGQF